MAVGLLFRPLALPEAVLVLSQRISLRFSDKTSNLNKSRWAIISGSPKNQPALICGFLYETGLKLPFVIGRGGYLE